MAFLGSCTILLLAIGSISADTQLTCPARCDFDSLGPIGHLIKNIANLLNAALQLLADLLHLDVLCAIGQNISDLLCLIISIICGGRTDLIDALFILLDTTLAAVKILLNNALCTGCLKTAFLNISATLQTLIGCRGLPVIQLIPQLIAGIGKLLIGILHSLLCSLPGLIKIILTMLTELLTKCDLDIALASCDGPGILTSAFSLLAIPLNTILSLLGLIL